jgi:hypothetical protein
VNFGELAKDSGEKELEMISLYPSLRRHLRILAMGHNISGDGKVGFERFTERNARSRAINNEIYTEKLKVMLCKILSFLLSLFLSSFVVQVRTVWEPRNLIFGSSR